MTEKRKDNKGRNLYVGESQRADGKYDYRYTDLHGKRKSVYAKSLTELRKKEAQIKRDLEDGMNYENGNIRVSELIDRYYGLKTKLKTNSQRAYGSVINRIHNDEFGNRKVNSIKVSDAKAWYVFLHNNGLKRNTIVGIHSIMRPAFEMAVDDDIIRKNPFKFNVSDLIEDDASTRMALSKEQQEQYLRFIKEYGYNNYYNDIVILLGTGMRVSELYGLTKSDIDLEHRRINIRHQLCRTAEKPYFITSPKSKSGIRSIPMSDDVYDAFCRELEKRISPKIEMIIDGCSGFLFLDKNGKPKVAMNLQGYMRYMQKKYDALYGVTSTKITPHVLRHTFCTNAQVAGIDVKSLQCIMGHSRISETLDTYTHTDYNTVERDFYSALANM